MKIDPEEARIALMEFLLLKTADALLRVGMREMIEEALNREPEAVLKAVEQLGGIPMDPILCMGCRCVGDDGTVREYDKLKAALGRHYDFRDRVVSFFSR